MNPLRALAMVTAATLLYACGAVVEYESSDDPCAPWRDKYDASPSQTPCLYLRVGEAGECLVVARQKGDPCMKPTEFGSMHGTCNFDKCPESDPNGPCSCEVKAPEGS